MVNSNKLENQEKGSNMEPFFVLTKSVYLYLNE